LSKTAARDERDGVLQGKARRARTFDAPPVAAGAVYEPTDAVLTQLARACAELGPPSVLAQYREWSKGKVPAVIRTARFLAG